LDATATDTLIPFFDERRRNSRELLDFTDTKVHILTCLDANATDALSASSTSAGGVRANCSTVLMPASKSEAAHQLLMLGSIISGSTCALHTPCDMSRS
jgi:hypothetical protein